MESNHLTQFLQIKNDKKIIQTILKKDSKYTEKLENLKEEVKIFFISLEDEMTDIGFEIGLDFALYLLNGTPIFNKNFSNLDLNLGMEEK